MCGSICQSLHIIHQFSVISAKSLISEEKALDLFLLTEMKVEFIKKLLQYTQPHTSDLTEMNYHLA